MTTPTSMGNHGGTVTSCSPYAYLGFAEICILLRTWSTVAPGTYELAFLIKKKKKIPPPHMGDHHLMTVPSPDVGGWPDIRGGDYKGGGGYQGCQVSSVSYESDARFPRSVCSTLL